MDEITAKDEIRSILKEMEDGDYDFGKGTGEIKRYVRERFEKEHPKCGISRPKLLCWITLELKQYMNENHLDIVNEQQKKEAEVKNILRNILKDMENENYDLYGDLASVKNEIQKRFNKVCPRCGILQYKLSEFIAGALCQYRLVKNLGCTIVDDSNEKQNEEDHLLDPFYINSRINKLKTYEAQIKSLNDKMSEYNKRCEIYEDQIITLEDAIIDLTNENISLRNNLMRLLKTIDEVPNLQ